jgi:hypothetical protein
MEEGFYMVFLEGGNTPAVKHEGLQKAKQEAIRLTLLHGKKAYVLESVQSFEVTQVTVKDCKPSAVYK